MNNWGRGRRSPWQLFIVAAVATGWHSLDELAAAKPDLLLPDPRPLLVRLG
jgi:hypothetical protein